MVFIWVTTMAIEILIIPCLSDNYAYIIHDKATNKNTLVDAPEFEPISACLEASNWNLDNILITHHHQDHIAGVEECRGCPCEEIAHVHGPVSSPLLNDSLGARVKALAKS